MLVRPHFHLASLTKLNGHSVQLVKMRQTSSTGTIHTERQEAEEFTSAAFIWAKERKQMPGAPRGQWVVQWSLHRLDTPDCGFEPLQLPPYSPDLSPFWFFTSFKTWKGFGRKPFAFRWGNSFSIGGWSVLSCGRTNQINPSSNIIHAT